MSGEKLLIVEDEVHLAEVIADNLELEGYAVEVVGDGREALEKIRREPPALVLLDVMLPGMDGFEVCERLRAEKVDVPILFMTARSDADDRIRGLELGGDDYLGKPFELRELMLRVAAILKRSKWAKTRASFGDTLVLGDASVDFKGYTAQVGEKVYTLSTKEILILRTLAERPGEVISRADILDRVWGYEAFPTERTIDNFIVRLRRLLEPDPQSPRYIHTVRGTGYRLTP
ncbi:MAG: response regulator transcription factor [Planctomycetes bacterium]|jgi:two-component system alkaline phosphatase synthesis response regulator PhoP|nr:response regulator transcription factor [Planctomycetota bacterium]